MQAIPEAADGHPKGSPGYRRILAGLAMAGVATFAQLYSTQAVLPLMSKELGITAADAALSVSLATAGLAASVLPWSFVADRIGRVRAMAVAIGAATVLGLLVPFAPALPLVLGLRALEGVALGGIPAVAIAYLNEEIGKAHAALAAGSYVAGTTLGGLAGRLMAGPLGEVWGWRAGTLAVSVLAAASAALFLLLVPKPRRFAPVSVEGMRGAAKILLGHLGNLRLLTIYLQAFVLMGGFVAVYNYLGFRLHAAPFALPASVVSLLFLAYLSGTVSSRWGAALSLRFGRRTILLAGIGCMAAGMALTLWDFLPTVLAGLLLFTAGFFAAHSIGAGWSGTLPAAGKAQSASLYNLFYYLGSSLLGWLGGLVFQSASWAALAWSVIALACATAVATAVAHPSAKPAPAAVVPAS